MKIELREVPVANPEEFAERHDLVMEVVERDIDSYLYTGKQYYAALKDVEVKDGCILSSPHGNGNTPEAAILDYWPAISEQRIVVDAYKATRREIKVPRLSHSHPKF